MSTAKKQEPQAENKGLANTQDPNTIMAVISRAVSDPNTDPEKLERMFALHERMEAKRAESEFAAAMTAAQGEIGRVAADAENPRTRSKYASYAALDRVLRPIYTKHGFSLSFDTGDAPDLHVLVLCYVSHAGGHTRTYRNLMPADGKGAKGGDVMTKTHAAGSAMSYGARYLLKMIFNVAVGEDDDDGNAASAETITEEQAETIMELIQFSGADKTKFLAYMGVDCVENIPAKHYNKAVRSLKAKAEKK